MSNISKRRKEGSKPKIKSMGDHKEFLKRITKSLYYGQLPQLPRLSLPVTEISCSLWSLSQRGRSLRRLRPTEAATIARSACVSPCGLVLAILYLERLHLRNHDYLAATAPADLFLVSLMVANKFLQDDGEDDEVVCSEWAASGGIELKQLKMLEVEFLNAIDWNIFVNEKSFEAGLQWLERQVALKQGLGRGFFTYADLRATADGALLGALARGLAAACGALALSYVALVASALLVSNTCLSQRTPITGLPTTFPPAFSAFPSQVDNETWTSAIDALARTVAADVLADRLDECSCANRLRYREVASCPRARLDAAGEDGLKAFEPWWPRTSALNWLYRTSLVEPVQRWLEKVEEYSEFVQQLLVAEEPRQWERCGGRAQYACQWLNLSKLSVWVAAVSDR